MKRAAPWRSDAKDSYENDQSSSDSEHNRDSAKKTTSKTKSSQAELCKKKSSSKRGGIDLAALGRHGYKGGPSVMSVPPPRQKADDDDEKPDWKWSRGEESRLKETVESYADRLKTRAALLEGEQLTNVQTTREKREQLSFSQKEKRKRDQGQASRGKNYVEEEKRLLRESGIYSGFDS